MIIEQPARWLRILYPHALWRMDKEDHSVYLTFDDGPIPEATPFILDILDQFNAKAMFSWLLTTLENILNYMKRLFDEVTKSVTIPIITLVPLDIGH